MRFLFSLCILSFFSIAQAKESRTLDINPLNFSNRADCARDSKTPTRSVFFIADTLDVGKSLLRTGDILSRQETFTSEGIKRYRFTLQSLSKLVAEKLLRGELPLLNSKLAGFDALASDCKDGCPEMDDLVAEAWSGSLEGQRLQFPKAAMSCYEVKNFASLYPHLLEGKPTKDSLKSLGESMSDGAHHLVECNIENPSDLSVSFYQFDLRHIDAKLWNKVGFDFWSSFNVYYSWAFRHSLEAKQMSLNYHSLFRQVNLEELSFFFSNGCASISNPECSKDFLNTNSLRELSKVSENSELAKLQVFMPGPDHEHDDILRQDDGFGREDLAFDAHESATDWAKNFKDNMAKTRGFIRLKLTQSLSQLKFIRRGLEERLITDLTRDLEQLGGASASQRAQAFTFCSELTSATDREISFIRPKLAAMTNYTSIWNYSRSIHADVEADLDWSLTQFAPKLLAICDKLREEKAWQETDHPTPEMFSAWYQSFHYKKVVEATEVKDAGDYLVLRNGQTGKAESFCSNSFDCGKKLISSLIDLKISSDYATSLLSIDGQIKQISATSSMGERMACRMYDPWAQSKKAGFEFLKDIVLAGISTATIVPIYVDVSLAQKKVTSLQEVIKDGKVYYNPKFDRRSIQKSLIVDFGPLLGAPCAVAVSGDTRIRPPSYLAFEGITLQSCRDNQRINVTAESPEDVQNAVRQLSGCFTCTISLASTATSVGLLNPYVRPFFYVIRGVVKLVSNLRSPEDIPRSWTVNPNAVARTLKLNGGEIPKRCVRKLSRGEECIADSCVENIAVSLGEHLKLIADEIKVVKGGQSEIRVGEKTFLLETSRRSCSRQEISKEDFVLQEVAL
jgi:hypothetical protein